MKRYKRTGRQPKEQAQKKKRISLKMWVSIGIAIIMATSIAGFLTLDKTSPAYGQFDYNNFTITGAPQRWQVSIDGTVATFEFLPSDINDIPYPSDIFGWLRGVQAFSMTSSPQDNLSLAIGAVEYALFTQLGEQSKQGKIILYAFTMNNTFGKPILTCKDATPYQPVLLFEQGNETKIARQGDCIIATATSDYHMRRLGERILYTHFGIIQDESSGNDVTATVDR